MYSVVEFALPVKKWLRFKETDFIANLCKFFRYLHSSFSKRYSIKIDPRFIKYILKLFLFSIFGFFSVSKLFENEDWTFDISKIH